MYRPLQILLLCLAPFGCPEAKRIDTGNPSSNSGETDTDLLPYDQDTADDGGGGILGDCREITTKVNGSSIQSVGNPTVGDEWVVRMFCDGALLTGANRLFFTPPNVATVSDDTTDAVFVRSGSTTMSMQSGSIIDEHDLVVQAAR
ncbi:MAG: hypothetical protein ACPGTU_17485 [Myxococcota bacterium]